MGSAWTDERYEKLTTLVTEGYSASQIATMLNEMSGDPLSRNAVIGKIHRHGLVMSGTRNPASAERKANRQRKRLNRLRLVKALHQGEGESSMREKALAALKAEPRAKPRNEPITAEAIPLDQLTDRTCKFPLGDEMAHPPFLFCGKPTVAPLPYCAHHARLCYGTPSPSRNLSRPVWR